jgi:hypothetical protein
MLRAGTFFFYERRPSLATCLKLKMDRTRYSVGSPEAHPNGRGSTTVAQNIMLNAQDRAAELRRHSAVTASSHPIGQVCGFLPVVINSIRLLPHALWLFIISFHFWVIVDLLCPIASVC